jgi:hypothetical protein
MTTTNSTELKPVVGGSLSYGWETMKRHFLSLLLIVIVWSFIQAPFPGFKNTKLEDTDSLKMVLGFFAMAYFIFVMPIFQYGTNILFIDAVRSNEKLDMGKLVIGFKNYMNVILTHLFVTALTGMAFVALIIPGFIVACRLAFVSYLVMDKGMDPITAVETSWKMTKGYGWRIFWLGFTCVFIFIGGLACCIVGVFPAVIWCKAAFASLYQAVLDERTDLFPIKENTQV